MAYLTTHPVPKIFPISVIDLMDVSLIAYIGSLSQVNKKLTNLSLKNASPNYFANSGNC